MCSIQMLPERWGLRAAVCMYERLRMYVRMYVCMYESSGVYVCAYCKESDAAAGAIVVCAVKDELWCRTV